MEKLVPCPVIVIGVVVPVIVWATLVIVGACGVPYVKAPVFVAVSAPDVTVTSTVPVPVGTVTVTVFTVSSTAVTVAAVVPKLTATPPTVNVVVKPFVAITTPVVPTAAVFGVTLFTV